MELFQRSQFNPILTPDERHHWESEKLYNPGAVFHNSQYHLFYRALGHGQDWHSRIGYATSENGETFYRREEPLLEGENELELRGVEDPRITRIADTFYMAYTAYDGKVARLNIATSRDLEQWEKQGEAFQNKKSNDHAMVIRDGRTTQIQRPKEWSKSGALFPEKINGKYWMLFGDNQIWLATSKDCLNWQDSDKSFLKARQEGNYFDNCFVEMGPPPIRTDKGWLVIYHGIDNKMKYSIGLLLLDPNKPDRIISRSEKPVFSPRASYEIKGIVDIITGDVGGMENMSEQELNNYLEEIDKNGIMPQVTFCCGAVPRGDELRIFYGAGDTYICTATASIKELLKTL